MNAHSPKYVTPDGSAIDLIIEHPDLGEIPFTASVSDTEPLGSDLYARAVAQEFGPIAAYDGPSAEEILADQMRAQRNGLLTKLDAIVGNPLRWAAFGADQQVELATYRQALLDVPQQVSFPSNIAWPQPPWELLPPQPPSALPPGSNFQ